MFGVGRVDQPENRVAYLVADTAFDGQRHPHDPANSIFRRLVFSASAAAFSAAKAGSARQTRAARMTAAGIRRRPAIRAAGAQAARKP